MEICFSSLKSSQVLNVDVHYGHGWDFFSYPAWVVCHIRQTGQLWRLELVWEIKSSYYAFTIIHYQNNVSVNFECYDGFELIQEFLHVKNMAQIVCTEDLKSTALILWYTDRASETRKYKTAKPHEMFIRAGRSHHRPAC